MERRLRCIQCGECCRHGPSCSIRRHRQLNQRFTGVCELLMDDGRCKVFTEGTYKPPGFCDAPALQRKLRVEQELENLRRFDEESRKRADEIVVTDRVVNDVEESENEQVLREFLTKMIAVVPLPVLREITRYLDRCQRRRALISRYNCEE